MNKLPVSTVKLITSTQVITSIYSVVKELVENSLDAETDHIEVILEENGVGKIEIRDYGIGIPSEDVINVCKPHYTSKITNHSDLQKLSTYGFRGEALYSLCSVSDVSITTKSKNDFVGKQYEFDHNGDIVSEKPSHHNLGTIVSVKHLFKNLPVRKQIYSNKKKVKEQIRKIEELLISYGLLYPKLRLKLRNNQCWLWNKEKAANHSYAIRMLFGEDVLGNLREVSLTNEDLEIKAFVPILNCKIDAVGRAIGDRIFIYVNGRPVIIKPLKSMLKQYFVEYCHSNNKYPISIMFIKVAPSMVDVNLEPNKTSVLLQNMESLLDLSKKLLDNVYITDATSKGFSHNATNPCVEQYADNTATNNNDLGHNVDNISHEGDVEIMQNETVTFHNKCIDILQNTTDTTDKDDIAVPRNINIISNSKSMNILQNSANTSDNNKDISLTQSFDQITSNNKSIVLKNAVDTIFSEDAGVSQNTNNNMIYNKSIDILHNTVGNMHNKDNATCNKSMNMLQNTTDTSYKEVAMDTSYNEVAIDTSYNESNTQSIITSIDNKNSDTAVSKDCISHNTNNVTTSNKGIDSLQNTADNLHIKNQNSHNILDNNDNSKAKDDDSGGNNLNASDINLFDSFDEEFVFTPLTPVKVDSDNWSMGKINENIQPVTLLKPLTIDEKKIQEQNKKRKLSCNNDILKKKVKKTDHRKIQFKVKQPERRHSASIACLTFSMEKLKEIFKQGIKADNRIPAPPFEIIGKIPDSALWVIKMGKRLLVVDKARLSEKIMYDKLLKKHKFKSIKLDVPIKINRELIGYENLQLLLQLDTESSVDMIGRLISTRRKFLQKPKEYIPLVENVNFYFSTRFICNDMITDNGFYIKRIDSTNSNETNFECTRLTNIIADYNIEDLVEILNSYRNSTSHTLRSRKAVNWCKDEAARLSQISADCSKTEVEDIFDQVRHTKDFEKTLCCHDKCIFTEIRLPSQNILT